MMVRPVTTLLMTGEQRWAIPALSVCLIDLALLSACYLEATPCDWPTLQRSTGPLSVTRRPTCRLRLLSAVHLPAARGPDGGWIPADGEVATIRRQTKTREATTIGSLRVLAVDQTSSDPRAATLAEVATEAANGTVATAVETTAAATTTASVAGEVKNHTAVANSLRSDSNHEGRTSCFATATATATGFEARLLARTEGGVPGKIGGAQITLTGVHTVVEQEEVETGETGIRTVGAGAMVAAVRRSRLACRDLVRGIKAVTTRWKFGHLLYLVIRCLRHCKFARRVSASVFRDSARHGAGPRAGSRLVRFSLMIESHLS